MSNRLILLASARSYRNRPFTEAAAKLGVEVILGLDVPPPMLNKVENALAIDYRDLRRATDAIVKYARQNPVGAIIGVDDSGTQLAARASAALGLPYNSPEAAQAAADKSIMRQRFAAAGVPSPVFRQFNIHADPEDIADAIPAEIGYPCVIKPTRLSTSKGVMRADNPMEFVARWERLRRILANERCDDVLVEAFIPGVEVAVEGLLNAGNLRVLALFDKPDPLEGPFFEETIYVTPSRLPETTQRAIFAATEQAAAALGLREGPVHAELRIDLTPSPALRATPPPLPGSWPGRGGGGEAILVEVAARSIGGLCSRTLRFTHSADTSLEELILRQALGMELDTRREGRAGGVMMIPIPSAGLLRSISGIEDAERVPLIESVEITAALNYPLIPLPEGDAYLGFIFARGENPANVEAALREAHKQLRFEIEPEILVRIGASSSNSS